MESKLDLAKIMAAKSEDQLLAVLTNPDDYVPEAPAAAVAELRRRNLSPEQTKELLTILEHREAQSKELCPHCLRLSSFEVFSICSHCGQDKNAVRFSCPKCWATLEAPRISAGSSKQCSGCGTATPVPSETTEDLIIDSAATQETREGNLQRLHAALVKAGLKESEWELTLIELIHTPPEKLVDHLRSKNIDITSARAGARAIQALDPVVKKEIGNEINKNIVCGGCILGLGAVATLLSFSTVARSGGSFWIWYGPIIWGAIQLLIGLDQDRRRRGEGFDAARETHDGPRCVACSAPLKADAKLCPQCGWTQPT